MILMGNSKRTDPSVRDYRTGLLPWVMTRIPAVSVSAHFAGLTGSVSLCPEPGLLKQIPLGQSPSLHSLRKPKRTTALVRKLPRYYGTV